MSNHPNYGDLSLRTLASEDSRVNVTTQKEPRHTVKTRTTVKTILCALVLAAVAHGQQIPPLAPPRAGFSFPQKQTLTYSVDWRVFPAGTAVVHFEAPGDRERISATADTIGAINLLFHVSDHFQSTIDRAKGCTYEFDKQTVEGRRQVNSTLRMDYGQNKSILDEKNLVTGKSKHVESPVPGCMTDLLTGVFYAASQPLAGGAQLRGSPGGRHAQRAGDHEGGRPRRDQDHAGNIQDHPRAAHGRRRRGEESRQHLDLVHRR